MAALTDGGPPFGDGLEDCYGQNPPDAIYTDATGRPPAEGSLIILSPNGGTRG